MIRLVTKAFRWSSVQITFLLQKTAFSGLFQDHPVVLSSQQQTLGLVIHLLQERSGRSRLDGQCDKKKSRREGEPPSCTSSHQNLQDQVVICLFVQADKITNMIGYPEYIMNNTALEEKYSDLFAEENSYFANSVRFNKVRWIDLSLLLQIFLYCYRSFSIVVDLSQLLYFSPSGCCERT